MEVNRSMEVQAPGRHTRIVEMSVQQASTKTRQHSHALDTRLQGRWLLLARAGWVVLVVLTLTIFFASLPVYMARQQTLCVGTECTYGVLLTPSQAEVLKGIGLSLSDYAAYTVAFTLATIVVCLVVSTLIVWRRSDDRMAVLAALMLVTLGTLDATSTVAASSSPWRVPAECLVFLALALFVLVFLLFPTGQFVPRWTRWIAVGCLAVLVPATFFPNNPLAQNPDALLLFYLVSLVAVATLALAQLYRYRRVSSPMQRQQTKWVVFGLAMPRDRLWDIDVLINRTLVYSALTAFIVGVYVLVVGILSTLLHAFGNVFISLLATGLVAVLFQPLRARLQRLINHLMYGERDDPHAVLSRLGRRLEATLAPEAILSTIVETVAQALKLPYAAIALKQGDEFVIAASYGLLQGKSFILPLVYHTEAIGQLLLDRRAPGDVFTAADRRLL